MSERPLKTLQDFPTSKLNTVCHQHKVAAQAAASNSNLRWLRVPATTFVITLSPSRSNRRDGFSFSAESGTGRRSRSGCVHLGSGVRISSGAPEFDDLADGTFAASPIAEAPRKQLRLGNRTV